MFKKIMSIVVWPLLGYSLFLLLEFETTIALDDDILMFAKKDTAAFIWIFFILCVIFVVISVIALMLNHRFFGLKGTYDGAVGVLNIVTTFTSVTALIVQFAGGEIPKAFLTLTLATIMLTMALGITSHLLKWRLARKERQMISSEE